MHDQMGTDLSLKPFVVKSLYISFFPPSSSTSISFLTYESVLLHRYSLFLFLFLA